MSDNTSLLTFNCSVAGSKSFLVDYNDDIQIMPSDTKVLTDKQINSYPEITDWRRSVIHTSYITRPFSDHVQTGKTNSIKHIIEQYIRLANRIKFMYILIHLPSTEKEMDRLGDGMTLLKELFVNNESCEHIIPLLEIPAFKGGFKMDIDDYFAQIVQFVSLIPNMEICLDTAHLYSNGCDCDKIISLYDSLSKYVNVFHLNGNENNMWKSDKHIPLFEDRNKLKDYARLVDHIKDKNLLLITENTTNHASYEKWKTFCDSFGISIVSKHDKLSV